MSPRRFVPSALILSAAASAAGCWNLNWQERSYTDNHGSFSVTDDVRSPPPSPSPATDRTAGLREDSDAPPVQSPSKFLPPDDE